MNFATGCKKYRVRKVIGTNAAEKPSSEKGSTHHIIKYRIRKGQLKL